MGDDFQVGKWKPARPPQVDGARGSPRDHHHLDHRHVPDVVGWTVLGRLLREWKYVDYTPLLVGTVLILCSIYWHVSVKHWFTGPITQVDATEKRLEGVSLSAL